MKTILSLSLGSSRRDKAVEAVWAGQRFRLERRGYDGDLSALARAIEAADGQVDVMTLGGINFNLVLLDGRALPFRDATRLRRCARRTPFVDGELYREHVEPVMVRRCHAQGYLTASQRVLFPLVSNRLGMARELESLGFRTQVYGDLVYDLGVPVALSSLKAVQWASRLAGPIVTRVPFTWVYPTGPQQERMERRRPELFEAADLIAGDFHNIRRFLVDDLSGKTILTNTVTGEDRALLASRGLARLITTSPRLDGRSFGANVVSGVVYAMLGKPPREVTPAEFLAEVDRLGLSASVEGPRELAEGAALAEA